MLNLAAEGGWALCWFTIPMILLAALFVYQPWTLVTGKPYRDHITRALGRRKVWLEIRKREDDYERFNRKMYALRPDL